MKTTYPDLKTIPRGWHLVDADGQILGRMAVRVATILMGKHRPIYTPHLDTGEFVVIVNAEKVKTTGTKIETRVVRHHTGWIGGLVERPAKKMIARKPEELVTLAVRRMLPKSKLGRRMLTKLKVYRGPNHPHAAQNPKPLAASVRNAPVAVKA
jgi:large subunit ribosomal protein L13